jgi:hypothetical protein
MQLSHTHTHTNYRKALKVDIQHTQKSLEVKRHLSTQTLSRHYDVTVRHGHRILEDPSIKYKKIIDQRGDQENDGLM